MVGEPAAGDVTVIAVLTYRRNDGLVTALPALLREAASLDGPATVLVIDNNPDGAAQAVVAPFEGSGVRYVHEPAPGIAAARNRALREAGARLLAFIDDDMHPGPGWLAALVGTQRASGAAVVVGPVLAEYEAEPDEWVRAGGFFVRPRRPTGTPMQAAASSNMLLDLRQIAAFGVRFDDRFGLLGGSDNLFTRTLAGLGARLVWCDEAIAFDRVPASRMTRAWTLRRRFRLGNSQVLVSLALCGSRAQRLAVRARATVGGGARVALGSLRWAAGVLTANVGHRARGRRMLHRGAGMVAGAYGYAYAEYARPHQSPTADIGTR